MNTANLVPRDSNPDHQQEDLLQASADLQSEDDILTRWFPDWMVLRIARWNLPAPLALAIVAVALLGAVLAPIMAANGRLGLIISAAILGIGGLVIIVKKRILGLVLLPVVAMMVPFAIGTGSSTGINAAVLLLGLNLGLWLLDMISSRQIRLLPYRPVIVSIIFGVVAILAFGFGQLSWFSTASAPLTAQIGGLLVFILSIGAFLLAAHQIKTLKELEVLTWVFLGIGFLFFTFRLSPVSLSLIERIFVRQGVLGATLYVWLVAIASSQAIFNKNLTTAWRAVLGLLVLMIFVVNLNIDNRYWISGWLPAIVALITVIVLVKPGLGLFAITGGVFVLLFNPSIITGITEQGDNTYSTITRLEAWRIMAQIIKANPIFGLGMANYYWYTPLFPIMGYAINFNSHNNYIDIIAQTGLVGLACFLWFFAELWFLGWRMRNLMPEGFPYAYVTGVLGGLVGTVVAAGLGDWVIPFVYNIGLEGFRSSMFAFLFLGGLVALARIYNIPPSRSIEASSR